MIKLDTDELDLLVKMAYAVEKYLPVIEEGNVTYRLQIVSEGHIGVTISRPANSTDAIVELFENNEESI